ncbi:restriction endonuclease [Kitasatospora herbaricolor]|uniref:restriction endonuclease n=1 Tax=Kitasatospora herbaricolor TaxID=68217 RepID=UPI0036DB9B4E
MRDDGTFDPVLKFLAGGVLALAAAKMLWHWVSTDMWAWICGHPWWTALIAFAVLLAALLIGLVADSAPVYHDDSPQTFDDPDDLAQLTYRMRQLEAMTPTGFEQACADLLARDGFSRVRRVGGAGDLGADVIAWDDQGRKLVLQCKQYQRPVGSRDVQTFNGTARPEHDADVPIMVGLNGFTRQAVEFADRHALVLVDRQTLKAWAHGTHLYQVLDDDDRAAA